MSASNASPVDLARILDEGPWGSLQQRVLVLAALAFAVDGLANQVLGLAVPALIHAWGTPREAFAKVAALSLIGVAVGTTAGGLLGDRLGRRWGLIGSILLFGVMTAATALAPDLASLTALRFLAGLGIGGAIPNGAALISEFSPLRRRSLALALGMLFIPVGGILAGVLGALILTWSSWRGLFFAAGLLPIVLALIFLGALPESPRYLMRWPARQGELLALLRRCGHPLEPTMRLIDAQAGRPRMAVAALFGAGILRDTLALWVAFFFCLLASYTLFSWVPTLLQGQGFGLQATSLGMTVFNVGGMAGAVTGGWLISAAGSRVPVSALALGATLGALGLGWLPLDPEHGTALTFGALGLEGFFIGGLHNGLYTLAAHMYPHYARASGVGTAAGVGRIGAVLSSFTGVLTLKLSGASGYFIVIAVAAGLALAGTSLIQHHVPRNIGRAGDERQPGPHARASPRS